MSQGRAARQKVTSFCRRDERGHSPLIRRSRNEEASSAGIRRIKAVLQ